MPSVTVHPRPSTKSHQSNTHPSTSTSTSTTSTTAKNPLPKLLQTPSGLAIVEVQGTFNLPPSTLDHQDQDQENNSLETDHHGNNAVTRRPDTTIGRLVFPFYDAANPDDDTAWMKRVYLYIGRHQRMTGEVKKLVKPIAILRRRRRDDSDDSCGGGEGGESGDLEIAEIVRFKVLFASRPEPVGVVAEKEEGEEVVVVV